VPTVEIFGNPTNSGYIDSSSSIYSTARAGSNLTALTANTTGNIAYSGQMMSGGAFNVFQTFLEFNTTSIPANATINSAQLWIQVVDVQTSIAMTFTVRSRDYGPTLTFADWVAGTGIGATTNLGTLGFAVSTPPSTMQVGANANFQPALAAAISGGTRFRLLVPALRQQNGNAPATETFEYIGIDVAQSKLVIDYSVTASDQSVTLGAFTDTDAFPAATITPDPATVSLPHLADTDAFPTATITTESVVGLTHLADTDAFPAATITPDPATVSLPHLADTDAFPTATITTESVVGLQHLDGTNVVHDLVVQSESVTIGLVHVSSLEVVHQPSLVSGLSITLAPHVGADTFPTSSVAPGAATIALHALIGVNLFPVFLTRKEGDQLDVFSATKIQSRDTIGALSGGRSVQSIKSISSIEYRGSQ
jgi:hypothetical protein